MKDTLTKIPLIIFLHFYQPPTQQEDILERIVFESYEKILNIFWQNQNFRATFSFPAGLAELLNKRGFTRLISKLSKIVKRGQVELTGTAAYHAFLPLLPVSEIKRQILLNEEGLTKLFDGAYNRAGFFPPELTYSRKVAQVVTDLGFSWMAIPMISLGENIPDFATLYKLSGYNLYLFPRHKWASSVILSGTVRSAKSFLEWIKNDRPLAYYLVIMDAETFGHHRPGLENLLEDFAKSKIFELLQVSDLQKIIKKTTEVEPREASWSNSEQDFWINKERKIAAKNPFLLWKDPANPIHKLQWRLTRLAIKSVENYKAQTPNSKLQTPNFENLKSEIGNSGQKQWIKARRMLDWALASDQYWWASAKPWWSLEMIEAGSWYLLSVVKTICGVQSKEVAQAEKIYRQILDQAFFWQRTGLIRKKHRLLLGDWANIPFKKRAPVEWYNQIILEFEDEMKRAAVNLEFEKAVQWRDAIYKLNSGADVFDLVHVVDELHAARKIPSLKPFLMHKDRELSGFAKKYLQKLTRKEIEAGKRNLVKLGYKID